MSEIKPNNLSFENKRPLSPEEIEELKKRLAEAELQHQAAEFSDAKQAEAEKGVPFDSGRVNTRHAETVSQIVGHEAKDTPDVHHEAGIPLKAEYTSEEERKKAVQSLIESNLDLTAPGKANKMQKDLEDLFNKAA